jgi:hypothetical protein
MSLRAEIIDTGELYFFKAKLTINQSAQEIFDFIAQPKNHSLMDGSGMVKGVIAGPTKLFLGAKFGMRMEQGLPYVINNQVIEFKEGESIAWQHLLHNVWRYEFKKVDEKRTEVTESWDARNARGLWLIKKRHPENWVPKAMGKSLVKLKEILEA